MKPDSIKIMDNRQKKERRFWDRFANYYDSFINKVFRKSYLSILENIESELNSNQDVLEIGTGTGIIPFSICSKVSSIVATDISPKMIHIASNKLIETKIQNIDFQIQDSYNLTYPDKSFDMVIASNLLHLLYEPKKPLNEVKRVLRENGIFIAPTLCSGENTKSKIVASIIGTLSGFKVVNKWSINEFKNMLTNNGFIITKTVIVYDKIPLAYIVMKNNIPTTN
ncbi:MAG: class I SAM-dependent methyltransferase [Bacteroidales bacterium]|nr:class I SAM-dependent methyltransferase [Bacteroidales bacterium]